MLVCINGMLSHMTSFSWLSISCPDRAMLHGFVFVDMQEHSLDVVGGRGRELMPTCMG